MPTLDLTIDSYGFRIQTPDLEMAGKWLMDLLMLHKPNQATYLQLRVHPFFVPDPKNPNGPWIPDWEADAQYYTNVSAISAAEAMAKFGEQLTRRAGEITPAFSEQEVIRQW